MQRQVEVMAFVRGVWFDNVIACYISVLPVAVLLIAASLGWCHRRLLHGINIWYAGMVCHRLHAFGSQYSLFPVFLQNINSSIFGWFGYVATIGHALAGSLPYWLYIALYFVFHGRLSMRSSVLRRYFEALPVALDNMPRAGSQPFPYFPWLW